MSNDIRKQQKSNDAPVPSDGKENSILLVDDEAVLAGLLTQFLSMRGYRIRAARNGQEALALLDEECPRLVILDMYMPGMNGIEVLREMRGKGYKGGVIALTASQDEKLLQQSLDLGSIDVMAKPVDLERLELAIQVAFVTASG